MTGPLHDDEMPVALPLVRALVDASFPDLATLPLRPLESTGSSNALFRLGACNPRLTPALMEVLADRGNYAGVTLAAFGTLPAHILTTLFRPA